MVNDGPDVRRSAIAAPALRLIGHAVPSVLNLSASLIRINVHPKAVRQELQSIPPGVLFIFESVVKEST